MRGGQYQYEASKKSFCIVISCYDDKFWCQVIMGGFCIQPASNNMRKVIFSLLVPLLVFTTNQPNLVLHKRYIYGFVNILISFGQHFQRHLGWLNHFPKGTRLTLPVTSTWPSCIDICTRRERMWKPRYISPVTAAFIWSLTRWRRWWRWSRQWRRWHCCSTRPTWVPLSSESHIMIPKEKKDQKYDYLHVS